MLHSTYIGRVSVAGRFDFLRADEGEETDPLLSDITPSSEFP